MRHDLIRAAGAGTTPAPVDLKEQTVLDHLRRAILADYPGRIALVSSFGADSVVLLHLVARIAPATPVLFNQTGMHFAETLAYQRELADDLGLANVRIVRPTSWDLSADSNADLHKTDPDACCHSRKVNPLQRALTPFRAWISGQKRHQSAMRSAIAHQELDATGRVKLNPLADWSARDLLRYRQANDLRPHPLVRQGYPSIGCAPCTTRVAVGEDPRAGRWRGRDKTECGIHFINGRAVRGGEKEA